MADNPTSPAALPDETETVETLIPQPVLTPGFHVYQSGQSLGCYPSLHEATCFAEGHLKPQGLEYEIREIA